VTSTVAVSQRHRELLDLFEAHFETERNNDVEACLATVADDIVYEHPFRARDQALTVGREAVRRYYQEHWAEQPFQRLDVQRSWLSGDDTLIVQVHTVVGRPGEMPRETTTFAIGTFRDGKLIREITASGPLTEIS
jgi:ketosteroid isomerase-like protein